MNVDSISVMGTKGETILVLERYIKDNKLPITLHRNIDSMVFSPR